MSIGMSLLMGANGSMIGIIEALATFKKTNSNEGAAHASLTSEVNCIVRGVDAIRLNQRTQASKIKALNEKVIRNEESIKQAHKRIDELRGETSGN